MAKTSPVELKLIRDKIMLYYRQCVEKWGMPADFFEESKKLVEDAFSKGKAKLLRSADRDIDAHIREMPIQEVSELKALFKEKLNIDYEIVEKVRIKAISRIIKKGVIATEEEYRLIQGRTDEICADGDKQDEMSKLNDLLIEYDKKIMNTKS